MQKLYGHENSASSVPEKKGAHRMTNNMDEKAACCLANSTSTADSGKSSKTTRICWGTELNRAYKELRSQGTLELRHTLLKSERYWTDFRDKEFAAIDRLYRGLAPGTPGADRVSIHFLAVTAKADLVKERALELANCAGHDTRRSYPGPIKMPNVSDAGADRLAQIWEDADDLRNKHFNQLMSVLNKPGQEALRASESEWNKFRTADFTLIDKLYDSQR
jgi:uncharacterized protein YecT (DUF1311 family)